MADIGTTDEVLKLGEVHSNRVDFSQGIGNTGNQGGFPELPGIPEDTGKTAPTPAQMTAPQPTPSENAYASRMVSDDSDASRSIGSPDFTNVSLGQEADFDPSLTTAETELFLPVVQKICGGGIHSWITEDQEDNEYGDSINTEAILGFRDGSIENAAFNMLEDVYVYEKQNIIFVADSQNSCIRMIDMASRRVSTAGWSMKPKCLAMSGKELYAVSDGKFTSFVFNKAGSMYFDYAINRTSQEDLEAMCFDSKSQRFYLVQQVQANLRSGRGKTRNRQVLSVDLSDVDPRRLRTYPPSFHYEFEIGDEPIVDMKFHPSGTLLIIGDENVYAATIVNETTKTIVPEVIDEEKLDKEEEVWMPDWEIDLIKTEPYDVQVREWDWQWMCGYDADCVEISPQGHILVAIRNKIYEWDFEKPDDQVYN